MLIPMHRNLFHGSDKVLLQDSASFVTNKAHIRDSQKVAPHGSHCYFDFKISRRNMLPTLISQVHIHGLKMALDQSKMKIYTVPQRRRKGADSFHKLLYAQQFNLRSYSRIYNSYDYNFFAFKSSGGKEPTSFVNVISVKFLQDRIG